LRFIEPLLTVVSREPNFPMRHAHDGCYCTLRASELPKIQFAMLQSLGKIITRKPRTRGP